MKTYRAPMDPFVIVVTLGVLVVLGVVTAAMFVFVAPRGTSGTMVVIAVAVTLFIVAIPIVAYAYTPRSYTIDSRELVIARPAGPVRIPLSVITDVDVYDAFVGLSLKVPPGGNSGLFGIYGSFYRKELGKFQMFSRSATRSVIVSTKDTKFLIAPSQREQFVSELRAASSTTA